MVTTERKLEEILLLQELGYDLSSVDRELKEISENKSKEIVCVETEVLSYLENEFINKLIYFKRLENDRLSPEKAEKAVRIELAKKFKTHSTKLNKYLEFTAKVIAIYCKMHKWKVINEKTIEIMLNNIAQNVALHKATKIL